MKINFLFILSFTLLISCSSFRKEPATTSRENIPLINLSEKITKKESFPLSEAVAKTDIVSLEVTDESILGSLNQVSVTSGDIWVSHHKESLVYRFSREGKYLNKVGKIGQGPGEYIQLQDFFIDELQKEIYIVSYIHGINVYDYEGNFKRRATKSGLYELFPAHNNKILMYNNTFILSQNTPIIDFIKNPQDSLWSLALVDSNFQIQKIFKNPAHKGNEDVILKRKSEDNIAVNYLTESSTNIDFYGNNFRIKYPDTDTIYQYDSTSDNLIPIYTITSNEEKGDYQLTHEWIKERKAFDYFTILDFFDTKNYIYLTGRKKKNLYTFAYNKETGKVDISEREGKLIERKLPGFSNPYLRLDCPFILNNDICGGNFEVKYRSNGKYWVDVLEYGTDNNWIDIEKVKNSVVKDEAAKKNFVNILNETGENSNPVLVIATLK